MFQISTILILLCVGSIIQVPIEACLTKSTSTYGGIPIGGLTKGDDEPLLSDIEQTHDVRLIQIIACFKSNGFLGALQFRVGDPDDDYTKSLNVFGPDQVDTFDSNCQNIELENSIDDEGNVTQEYVKYIKFHWGTSFISAVTIKTTLQDQIVLTTTQVPQFSKSLYFSSTRQLIGLYGYFNTGGVANMGTIKYSVSCDAEPEDDQEEQQEEQDNQDNQDNQQDSNDQQEQQDNQTNPDESIETLEIITKESDTSSSTLVIIGVILGVIVLLLGVFLCVFLKRKSKEVNQKQTSARDNVAVQNVDQERQPNQQQPAEQSESARLRNQVQVEREHAQIARNLAAIQEIQLDEQRESERRRQQNQQQQQEEPSQQHISQDNIQLQQVQLQQIPQATEIQAFPRMYQEDQNQGFNQAMFDPNIATAERVLPQEYYQGQNIDVMVGEAIDQTPMGMPPSSQRQRPRVRR